MEVRSSKLFSIIVFLFPSSEKLFCPHGGTSGLSAFPTVPNDCRAAGRSPDGPLGERHFPCIALVGRGVRRGTRSLSLVAMAEDG